MSLRNSLPYIFPIFLALVWGLCIFPFFVDKTASFPAEILSLIWELYNVMMKDFEIYITSSIAVISAYIVSTAPNIKTNRGNFIAIIVIYALLYLMYVYWEKPLEAESGVDVLLSRAGIENKSVFEESIESIRILIATIIASLIGLQVRKDQEEKE